MTIREFFNVWLAERRNVKAAELQIIKIDIQVLKADIKALDQQIRLLAKALEATDQHKLLSEVNDLKSSVAKMSSRLIGFSKTGIS